MYVPLYRLRIKTHVLNQQPCFVLSRDRNHLLNHLCHHLKLAHLPLHHLKNPSQRAVQRGSLLVQPKASKRGLVGKSNLFRPRNPQFQVIIWPRMVLHRHLVYEEQQNSVPAWEIQRLIISQGFQMNELIIFLDCTYVNVFVEGQ